MTDHVTIPAVDMDIRAELVRLVSDCQCDRYWPWHEGGEVSHEAGPRACQDEGSETANHSQEP